MTDDGHLLFDTPVGRCGLAWRDGAIAALQLPEPDDARTLRRMLRHLAATGATPPRVAPDQAPDWVRDVIAQVDALLAGRPQRLQDVPLDLRGMPDFACRVYELSRAIAPGRTLTYGEVARRLDAPGASRAVGRALGANPFAIIVPCHRVLAANGRSGGFSADGGARTKLALLALESPRDAPPEDDLFGWRT
ncbi:MAG: methylated-DNA--[protein]-cysteine S-methyltransferase [Burkholderiaceae bacterium]